MVTPLAKQPPGLFRLAVLGLIATGLLVQA